ncbi:hypothetical protein B0H13DRAFT_1873448 [Mycena leptocephala]|nr:hypothetical protein B0H13DRAFT_1873448 [Mycena leptocephala]
MYSSYFLWDYVSWATKAAILEELANRIFASEGEAQAVVDSSVFHHIWKILAWPDPVAQDLACWLLGLLASYKFVIPSILETKGCEQLVALLHNQDNQLVLSATHTAAQITQWSEGMQAVVNAKVQDPSKAVDEVDTSPLGIELHQKESRQPAFNSDIGDILIIFSVAILEELANRIFVSGDEARAVVHSLVFHHIWEILAWSDPVAQGSACWLLGLMACYEFVVPSILEARGCEQLVDLLHEQDNRLVLLTTHTAAQITRWSGGMQAVVNAKVQDPSKAINEVDISPPGIGLHQKESRQPAFHNNIEDILIIFSVCFH